jgi:hypothetical protein
MAKAGLKRFRVHQMKKAREKQQSYMSQVPMSMQEDED